MTAIWRDDGSGWRLLAPTGFPNEAALHSLVEQAPHILPLSGTPELIIVGREVALGNGYADLLAVEPSGRLAIIEVKLARNAEARRAVVTQALTYAAFLHGLNPFALDQQILGSHLHERGYENLAGAISSNDQEGSFDAAVFETGLAESLSSGRFRIIFVLDDVPEELVRLVGYLEAVSDKLVIDLIKVSAYEIGESRILVPQRIDPERRTEEPPKTATRSMPEGRFVSGPSDFINAIDKSPEPHRPMLHKLAEWAQSLEREGLVTLATFHGVSGRLTLLPRLHADNVGLVTIWNDNGAYISFWRSVFERRSPSSLLTLDQMLAPKRVGQGNTTRDITDELLHALTEAYREAVQGKHQQDPLVSE